MYYLQEDQTPAQTQSVEEKYEYVEQFHPVTLETKRTIQGLSFDVLP